MLYLSFRKLDGFLEIKRVSGKSNEFVEDQGANTQMTSSLRVRAETHTR
jgi:hypothetical protein